MFLVRKELNICHPPFLKTYTVKKYIQLPVNSTRKRKPRSYKYCIWYKYGTRYSWTYYFHHGAWTSQNIGNFLTVCWPRKSRMTTAAHSAAKIFKICGYTEKRIIRHAEHCAHIFCFTEIIPLFLLCIYFFIIFIIYYVTEIIPIFSF